MKYKKVSFTLPNKGRCCQFYIRDFGGLEVVSDKDILYEVINEDMYNLESISGKFAKIETVVDIGAHVGGFSVLSAKLFRPLRLIAVEPQHDNYDLLKRNIKLNMLTNVITPINAGINCNGSIELNVKNTGASRVGNLIAQLMYKDHCTQEFLNMLQALRIVHIDLLKLDCEGCEFLLDWDKVLKRVQIEYIVMEIHIFNSNYAIFLNSASSLLNSFLNQKFKVSLLRTFFFSKEGTFAILHIHK